MQPLPIGIQTFRDLREGNFLYVDKTPQIYPLIEQSKGAYFLSRPRRFGKSLTLSVLDEIFSGNRELFSGLWIYDSPYEWKKYPVLRFDQLNGSKEEALSQIQERKYYEKYLSLGKDIYLVGLEIKDQNLGGYVVEKVKIQLPR